MGHKKLFLSAYFGFVLSVMFAASVCAGQPAATATQLAEWLSKTDLTSESLSDLAKQDFANAGLSQEEAEKAVATLWDARVKFLRTERAAEMKARELKIGDKTMPFWYRVFGDKPAEGRSLFISMHGGGNAPAALNDGQYENQKRLYQPKEGVYLVPRAPTNTWNLWHQAHIDDFFDRLITNLIVFEDVNPDRIYFMGYSAGGDGVYQLAPRMADRLAAASMMAGHPNETKPDGLRNIGFTIHVGAQDGGYNRNKLAGEWKEKLAALAQADPDGYRHHVQIHPGRGHWMNLEDAVAVPWMAKFTRNPWPSKVVWQQDDVTHDRFYWLAVDAAAAKGRPRIVASAQDNVVTIEESPVEQLGLLLHDDLLNLDKAVRVEHAGNSLHSGKVKRTVATIAETLLARDDPRTAAFARVELKLPVAK